MFGFLLQQPVALGFLLFFDRGEFFGLAPRLGFNQRQALGIGAQRADQVGFGSRQIAEVVQVAGGTVRVLARENQADRARFPVQVPGHQHPSQLLAPYGDLRLRVLAALGDSADLRLHRLALRAQIPERAVRLRYRALGLLQLVTRLGTRFLGIGDVLLQLLDATAKHIQIAGFLGNRTEGARQAEYARHTGNGERAQVQAFAFPWLATAAAAASIAAASPR